MALASLWSRHAVIAAVLLLPVSGGSSAPDAESVPAFASAALEVVTEHLVAMTAPPQDVVAGTVLVARPGQRHRRAAHADDAQYYEISATGSNDVPVAALAAYQGAASDLATSYPGCHLSWTLLAAVGRVESDHGRHGGSVLGSDGVPRPAIIGPRLDGAGSFAAIPDSDGGTLDGDRLWDRAVGPMQFLPTTWREVASDGDGNGTTDPMDIDDAALGSGRYLCRSGDDLADPAGMADALFRYNGSDYYVSLVMAFEQGYRTGVFVTPSPPPPPGDAAATDVRRAAQPRHRAAADRAAAPVGSSRDAGSGSGTTARDEGADSGTPTTGVSPQPSPSPTPTPTPKPPAPAVVDRSGTLTRCGENQAAWCLDTLLLDLGDPASLASPAPRDLDGINGTRSWAEELTGLLGTTVALSGEDVTGATPTLRVSTVNGVPLP